MDQVRLKGPWLIDGEKLKELDRILDEEWRRLEDYAVERLERKKTKKLSTKKREITITFKGGEKISVDSFEDASRKQTTVDDVAVGFDIEMEAGGIRCSMSTDNEDNELRMSAWPETLLIARELYTRLHNWIIDVSPPKWQQWWTRLWPLEWILFGALVLIGVDLVRAQFTTQALYHGEVRRLLSDGLSQEDQTKAVEILLGLAADVPPPQRPPIRITGSMIMIGVSLLVCVGLSFRPGTILGIGKGQMSIKRWRSWLKWFFCSAPVFISTSLVWPLVVDLVNKISR